MPTKFVVTEFSVWCLDCKKYLPKGNDHLHVIETHLNEHRKHSILVTTNYLYKYSPENETR